MAFCHPQLPPLREEKSPVTGSPLSSEVGWRLCQLQIAGEVTDLLDHDDPRIIKPALSDADFTQLLYDYFNDR